MVHSSEMNDTSVREQSLLPIFVEWTNELCPRCDTPLELADDRDSRGRISRRLFCRRCLLVLPF